MNEDPVRTHSLVDSRFGLTSRGVNVINFNPIGPQTFFEATIEKAVKTETLAREGQRVTVLELHEALGFSPNSSTAQSIAHNLRHWDAEDRGPVLKKLDDLVRARQLTPEAEKIVTDVLKILVGPEYKGWRPK